MAGGVKDGVYVPRFFVQAFVGILTAGVIGGGAALLTATGWAAKIEEKLEGTTQLASITSQQYLGMANDMSAVKQDVKNVKDNLGVIRDDQREANRKLDVIIRSVR